jgi:hypothetical protein
LRNIYACVGLRALAPPAGRLLRIAFARIFRSLCSFHSIFLIADCGQEACGQEARRQEAGRQGM